MLYEIDVLILQQMYALAELNFWLWMVASVKALAYYFPRGSPFWMCEDCAVVTDHLSDCINQQHFGKKITVEFRWIDGSLILLLAKFNRNRCCISITFKRGVDCIIEETFSCVFNIIWIIDHLDVIGIIILLRGCC